MGKTAVIGLGITGKSAIAYLHEQGEEIVAYDTRAELAGVDELQQRYPQMPIHLGSLAPLLQESVDRVLVSPGVPLDEPVLQKVVSLGMPLINDIDLFLEENTAPVIAVTGSNGKTTVTTWVGECLQALGYRVSICGNIGVPVLSCLGESVDFVVMELSSFQLELSRPIQAEVAVCLNISPDHLDRHGSLDAYMDAKMRVYRGAKIAIVNADTGSGYHYQHRQGQQESSFSLSVEATVCYQPEPGSLHFLHGESLPINCLGSQSKQHIANALATLAILQALGISQADAMHVIGQCRGLPHRFQTVKTVGDVRYINDSKATNVGAAIVSMQAASDLANQVLLIAGGQSKSAPLNEWAAAVNKLVGPVFLYGQDAALMQQALVDVGKESQIVVDLPEAIAQSHSLAQPGDIVLLAPAAASFDMFKSYEARGEAFIQAVEQLDEH